MKSEPQVSALDYYQAVGEALSIWSAAEIEICLAFCACVNSRDYRSSESAFWSIISFEARLKMTGAALKTRLPDAHELVSEWATVSNTAKRKQAIRSKLAHGTVATLAYSKRGVRREDLFFAPYFWSGMIGRPRLRGQND